ncbi:hypothetical protein Lal_00048780 [Lupinus albus]|uniref:Putative PPC domain-containing protein n=1 Tax=Lupinus albus TaxID=3870 RepID=A0A6A4P8X8_LUPAL|nr:putative PPC domain-containing protein [Lupinus albus]KAF1864215.1 hypothetical protein Lal_00048780 [Lupinus albus]
MAENSDHAPSLSQTSNEEDNSSNHNGAKEHYSLTNNPPPHATVGYCTIQEHNMNHQSQQVLATPLKRPRGRPFGSKNKPKPPIVIRQQSSEDSLKPVVIEIPIGNNIIEALITFAHHHRVSISILSGSGSVTEITLRHNVFPINGTCRILSLTGSYIGVHLPSFASSNVDAFHPCSSFGIMVAGPQGKVFGGVIGGRVIAASVVMVVATVSKNPQFHRLSFINENIVDEENDENNNNAYGGEINVDRSGGNNNVMQWNHFNRLPYNY